jgi:HPt (histidine-containing phosphotransfer) domain-containing protein
MDAEEGASDLDRRLEAIRRRTRAAVLERVEAIELAAGDAADEQRSSARTEAHKLRGLLGTIGLARGSELAAAIETELEAVVDGRPVDGWRERVAAQAAQLRSEIEAP